MSDVSRRIPPKYVWFGVVSVLFVALDQITKWLVVQNIPKGHEVQVIDGFFSLVHAQNSGAVLGLFGTFTHRMWLFGIITVIAVFVLVSMLRQLAANDRFQATLLGLILSGALGNAIDRLHQQKVTDFLRFYTEQPQLSDWLIRVFKTNEYPSFNVADSAIVVGVALFMLRYLFLKDDKDTQGENAAAVLAEGRVETAAEPDKP
jgi:signal peptidase II